MIRVASSKHRSIRCARTWKSTSPDVETAWRSPARISRNLCSSLGLGCPKSRSHASDPKPATHERLPSSSRKPTERTREARFPQNDRITARLPAPGLTVTTRKIAARVSGVDTGWGTVRRASDGVGVVMVRASLGMLKGFTVLRNLDLERYEGKMEEFEKTVEELQRTGPQATGQD